MASSPNVTTRNSGFPIAVPPGYTFNNSKMFSILLHLPHTYTYTYFKTILFIHPAPYPVCEGDCAHAVYGWR